MIGPHYSALEGRETPRYHREMNEEQFGQLLGRAYRNEAPAEILAAVELEPGLVTRAREGLGQTYSTTPAVGDTSTLPATSWTDRLMCIKGVLPGKTH